MSSWGAPLLGATAAGRGKAAFLSPRGGGASGAGCNMGAAGQPGYSDHGWGSAGNCCGCGIMEVNVGRHGHCPSARVCSVAAASSALGASGDGPGDKNVDMDYGDDDEDNDDYEDDASDSNNNDDNDNEAL